MASRNMLSMRVIIRFYMEDITNRLPARILVVDRRRFHVLTRAICFVEMRREESSRHISTPVNHLARVVNIGAQALTIRRDEPKLRYMNAIAENGRGPARFCRFGKAEGT